MVVSPRVMFVASLLVGKQIVGHPRLGFLTHRMELQRHERFPDRVGFLVPGRDEFGRESDGAVGSQGGVEITLGRADLNSKLPAFAEVNLCESR